MAGTYALYLLENGQTVFHRVTQEAVHALELGQMEIAEKLGEGTLMELLAVLAGLA